MEKSKYLVEVIGLGKAGLPLASVIADSGIKVIGVDINKKTVESITKGVNPIPEEPGLGELIKKYSRTNLTATSNLKEASKKCNVHIIIVPLFIDDKKQPDFNAIDSAAKNISKGLKKGDLVVLETTVPVGTTETRLRKILEDGSGMKAGEDFFLAFSPERIMTGYSISRFREFPKIVGGINNDSTKHALNFYKNFSNISGVKNSATAEMAKIAEGIYRDVNIALANELYKVAEKYNINYWELKDAAKHQYCNLLEPGNVGGHCIPVYPWFIINDNPSNSSLTKSARDINDSMADYYASKALKIIGNKPEAKICVVGLSYREGVKEHAYTRSIPLIKILKAKGFRVYGADNFYTNEEIKSIFNAEPLANDEELKNMDAVILMNKIPEYKKILLPMKKKIVDVKNMLN